MEFIVSIISLIVALLAIFAVVFRFGQRDQALKQLCEAGLPERMIKMEVKQEVLWTSFTEQILSSRPDLAKRGSAYQLTEQAVDAVSEIMGLLYSEEPNDSPNDRISAQVLYTIPNNIGMEKLKEVAGRHNLKLIELLSILSVELGIDV